MLQQFAPRLPAQARQFFLRRPSTFGALPRHPIFFSTTATRFDKQPASGERQGSGAVAVPAAAANGNQTAEAEAEPTPTNLDNPPESVSCTVMPPSTYAFLKPTPVVLLTGPFGGNWCFRDTWQTSLADQGYQSTSIELSLPPQSLESGDAYIRHFVKILKTSIETDHSFYPPILIAHGLHALVAQKYVESNPVSALVLVSPFIPGIIKSRFSELSHKLKFEQDKPFFAATAEATSTIRQGVQDEKTEKGTSAPTPAPVSDAELSSPLSTPTTAAAAPSTEKLQEFDFKTHADVIAQDGFRERFVLPKKAVYKIDQVAREMHEKEKQKEQKEREKEVPLTKEEDAALKGKHLGEQDPAASTKNIESTATGTSCNTDNSSPASATAVTDVTEAGSEELGRDSLPVWDANTGTFAEESKAHLKEEVEEEALPVLTVESEASIPSALEQLPLSIYDSIPTSMFEPNFPILLITSNADEIVSTADVKTHHALAGQVDHIELEDLDDGGHLIMVSDNTEWEQGIQGITAWLDSNGM